MAATRQQVNISMPKQAQGKTQAAAAAKAGISERSGRRIEPFWPLVWDGTGTV